MHSPLALTLTLHACRYEDERRALRGLLHQALLERELLIVGFSMTDDNVHLIIDQCRKALDKATDGVVDGADTVTMGTILTLVENVMFRRLWQKDFKVVSCGGSWADEPAWMHDIFLDAMGAELVRRRAHDSFVLDPDYESLLDSSQRKIKAALQHLIALEQDDEVRSSSSWPNLHKMLLKLGLGGGAND